MTAIMRYADLRTSLKSGDVLAWSRGDWKSLNGIKNMIIRFVTMSRWNHVGVLWVTDNRVFVVEATIPEVRIYPLSKLLPCDVVLVTHVEWNKQAEDYLLRHVGQPYSVWLAIKSLFCKDSEGDKYTECAKLVNNTFLYLDPNFKNVLDTPARTIEYLIDKGAMVCRLLVNPVETN